MSPGLIVDDDGVLNVGLVIGDTVVMATAAGGATNRLLFEDGDGILLEDSSGDLALES